MNWWGRLIWLIAGALGAAALVIFGIFASDVNPWDRFTWLMAATLAISAVVIFAFFTRDAKDILKGSGGAARSQENPPEEVETEER